MSATVAEIDNILFRLMKSTACLDPGVCIADRQAVERACELLAEQRVALKFLTHQSSRRKANP